MAAGTLTPSIVTETTHPVTRYLLPMTSTSGGAVTQDFTFNGGTIATVECYPGSGSSQPTDLSDLVIETSGGIDVLMGVGANLSNATAAIKQPVGAAGLPIVLGKQTLTVKWTNAGDTKGMTVVLNVR